MYSLTTPYSINTNGHLLMLDKPKVMAILNATPDSFYAQSRCPLPQAAAARVGELLSQGADIIDIGACSTRPDSGAVSEQEELNRLLPVLEAIRKDYPTAILSVDTWRASVARRSVEEFQVDIINDVSGGDMDAEMFETVARCNVPYVLSHIRGSVHQMNQTEPYDNLMVDICRYLADRMQRLRQLGVNDIIVDPGFGFGKRLCDNYELLNRLADLSILDAPILVGVSRKSMIHRLLDCTPQESLNGTSVVNTLALAGGAHILRVHDVKQAVECVRIFQAYNEFSR